MVPKPSGQKKAKASPAPPPTSASSSASAVAAPAPVEENPAPPKAAGADAGLGALAEEKFTCSRCQLVLPCKDLCGSSRKPAKRAKKLDDAVLYCDDCQSTYKCLTRRWKKNRKLQTQYENYSTEERVTMFKRHKALRSGRKGKHFARTLVKSSHFKKEGKRKANQVRWINFEIFQHEWEMKGLHDENAIKAKWRTKLMLKGTKVRTIRGEKHFARYEGVLEEIVNEEGHEGRVEHEDEVNDEAGLADSMKKLDEKTNKVQQRLDTYFASLLPAPVPENLCDVADEYIREDNFKTAEDDVDCMAVDDIFDIFRESDEAKHNLDLALMEEELAAEKYSNPLDTRDVSLLRTEFQRCVLACKSKHQMALDDKSSELSNLSLYVKDVLFKGQPVSDAFAKAMNEAMDFEKAAVAWMKSFENGAAKAIADVTEDILRRETAREFAQRFDDETCKDDAFSKFKSSVTALNRLVDKATKSSTKTAKGVMNAVATGNDEDEAASLPTVLASLAASSSPNLQVAEMKKDAFADKLVPGACLRMQAGGFETSIPQLKAWKAYREWFIVKLSNEGAGKEMFKALIPRSTLAVQLKHCILQALGEQGARLFTAKIVTEKDLGISPATLYDFNCVTMAKNFTQVSTKPFCMNEGYIVFSGKLVVVGSTLQATRSLDFVEAEMKNLTTSNVAEFAKRPGNFAVAMNAGDMCVFPSGCCFAVFAMTEVWAIRWAFSPFVSEEDARVKLGLAKMLESKPPLRTTPYQKVFDYYSSLD
eukprot:TRINITY_DN36921_c0_g1_i1.p1 TRINITY_DN36921_c0_g1~~TRINITY_DN36921_c0_g1_i1.p1  ORF type:complete len:789 (-),score=188.89 TRINITY_DN36921_c0_g1_i1:220-2505(-)